MAAIAPSRLVEEGRIPALIFAGVFFLIALSLAIGFFTSPPELKAMLAGYLNNMGIAASAFCAGLSGWVTHTNRKIKEKEAEQGTMPKLQAVQKTA